MVSGFSSTFTIEDEQLIFEHNTCWSY